MEPLQHYRDYVIEKLEESYVPMQEIAKYSRVVKLAEDGSIVTSLPDEDIPLANLGGIFLENRDPENIKVFADIAKVCTVSTLAKILEEPLTFKPKGEQPEDFIEYAGSSLDKELYGIYEDEE